MVDISKLDLNLLNGKLSREDYERLEKYKPQTLYGAKRAGIKPAAMMIIYNMMQTQWNI